MAVIGLTARRGSIRVAHAPDFAWDMALSRSLDRLPSHAPVAVMVHGYRYSPNRPCTDPHRLMFSPSPADPRARFTSWPRGLGFTMHGRGDGLAIGFGWPANDLDHGAASGRIRRFRSVYAAADEAGGALAHVLDAIARLAPWRKVDVIAHSLGARVTLQALRRARRARPGQIVLLAGAEYDAQAMTCLSSPVARRASFYNITSRENDFYDILFRLGTPPPEPGARPLGRGLPTMVRNWIDLPLDRADLAPVLDRRGIRLSGPVRRVCHWNVYTRPGAFDLYASLIRERHAWTLPQLRAEIAALTVDPPRSRLLPWLARAGDTGDPRAVG